MMEKTMSKLVFVEGYDQSLYDMFKEEGYTIVDNILKADLLCLEGGYDVSPEIYGEENTDSQSSLSHDINTFGLMAIATLMDIPIVGICRGHQALCVHQGGKLKQHINGHCQWHNLVVDGELIPVSSSHHQEAIPYSGVPSEDVYYAEDGVCEVILYREDYNLGFQPHPEYHQKGHPCWELFFQLIDEVCFSGY